MTKVTKSEQQTRSGLTVTAEQNMPADGISASLVTAVQDVINTSATITFSTSGSAHFAGGGQEITTGVNVLGVATTMLLDTVEETVAVSAVQSDGKSGVTTVTFGDGGGGTGEAIISSLVVDKGYAQADGAHSCQVTVFVLYPLTGIPASGVSVTFKASNGAVIHSPVTTDVNGYATTTLTSTTPGFSIVTASLSNGSQASGEVFFASGIGYFSAITAGDGHEFAINVGFPQTAFLSANFTLHVEGGSTGLYRWNTDRPDVVSVSDTGVVTFTGRPSGTVEIFAISEILGIVLVYTINVNYWFEMLNNGNRIHWSDADATYGNVLPPRVRVSTGDNRDVGSAYGEWGILSNSEYYPATPFDDFWINERSVSYYVNSNTFTDDPTNPTKYVVGMYSV